MADGLQRYRVPIGWLILGRTMGTVAVVGIGAAAFRAIFSGLDAIGSWTSVGFLSSWLFMAALWTCEVVLDPEREVLTFRSMLGPTRSRALADLRGVERRTGMVTFAFDRRTFLVTTGPGIGELVAEVHRLRPDLADPAVRAFTIVLRGYDRAQVDTYLRQARSGGLARPTFRVVLRGYDRAEVDRAVAELSSGSGSGSGSGG